MNSMNHLRQAMRFALVLLFSCSLAVAQQTAPSPNPAADSNGIPSNWKQIPIPPLPKWTPVQPKRIELPNGMILFLQEDHELPLINALAMVRGGARTEPADRVGLLDIYGDVWRTGGTSKMTGDQMDDFLEARAAKVETDNSEEYTTISFDCLKDDFDDVFRLFSNLLHDPEFRQDKIQLAKNQLNSSIARRNDSSQGIADREAAKLAYGKHNPYAREPEYATVAAVKRDDLVNWYKQHVAPNNIIFGIVGDFDSVQMEKKLRAAFAGWKRGPQAEKPEIPLTPAKAGLYVVDKADVNQSEIRFVTLGIERRNPDYFPVQVMNEVLSGGFSSRLMADLRTKRGLAYAVSGSLGAGWDHQGIFWLTIGTKSASTVDAIEGMREDIEKLKADPPSQSELEYAKDAILNSFIFRLNTPKKVLRERMTYQFFGYPLNFLEIYRTQIEKVTTTDVNRVIQKYVHPDQFAVLVVGNASQFEKPLAALGPVTKLDITIPGGEIEAASAGRPGQSNAAGKELMAKVVQFLGGEAKLKSIQSLQQKATVQEAAGAGTVQAETDQILVYPNKLISMVSEAGQQMKMVVTPQSAFQAMPGHGVTEMPASVREDILKQLRQDFLDIARHASDPKYVFVGDKPAKVEDAEAMTLDIYAGDLHERWFVNPANGELLRSSYETMSEQGPVQAVVDYANWKQVDGITLPFSTTTTKNGQLAESESTQSWTVNPKVDPALFERPASAAAVPH